MAVGFNGQLYAFYLHPARPAAQYLAAGHCYVQRNSVLRNALARHRKHFALKKRVAQVALDF